MSRPGVVRSCQILPPSSRSSLNAGGLARRRRSPVFEVSSEKRTSGMERWNGQLNAMCGVAQMATSYGHRGERMYSFAVCMGPKVSATIQLGSGRSACDFAFVLGIRRIFGRGQRSLRPLRMQCSVVLFTWWCRRVWALNIEVPSHHCTVLYNGGTGT